jgi:hypothetical protein
MNLDSKWEKLLKERHDIANKMIGKDDIVRQCADQALECGENIYTLLLQCHKDDPQKRFDILAIQFWGIYAACIHAVFLSMHGFGLFSYIFVRRAVEGLRVFALSAHDSIIARAWATSMKDRPKDRHGEIAEDLGISLEELASILKNLKEPENIIRVTNEKTKGERSYRLEELYKTCPCLKEVMEQAFGQGPRGIWPFASNWAIHFTRASLEALFEMKDDTPSPTLFPVNDYFANRQTITAILETTNRIFCAVCEVSDPQNTKFSGILAQMEKFNELIKAL